MYTYRVYGLLQSKDASPTNGLTYVLKFTKGDHLKPYRNYRDIEMIKSELVMMHVQTMTKIDRFAELDAPIHCYRYRQATSGEATDWYTNKELAYVDAVELGIAAAEGSVVLDTGLLFEQTVVNPRLPIETTLELGEKGLFTKMELNPVENGFTGGKFYFPDRSCLNLCAGPAIIHGVVDRESYGFITVTMKHYEIPHRDHLLEFLLDCIDNGPENGQYDVSTILTPFGEVVIVDGPEQTMVLTGDEYGEVYQADELIKPIADLPDTAKTVIQKFPIKDYICHAVVSCGEVAFSQKFVGCNFQFPDAQDDQDDEDPLMLEVAETLVIERKKIGNINYYTIDWKRLYEIVAQFDEDEIEEIRHRVNTVNTRANVKIVEQLKSGKMRMSL